MYFALIIFPSASIIFLTQEKVIFGDALFRETYKNQSSLSLDLYFDLDGIPVLQTFLSVVALVLNINFSIFGNVAVLGISTYVCLLAYKLGCDCERYFMKDVPFHVVSTY